MTQFNPNDHLMQLKSREGSKDYLPVQWRLVWFRQECPEGTIDTQEMEVDTERECTVETFVWNKDTRRSDRVMKTARGYARFRAVVTDGKGGRATGTKSECRASFDDYIEKAETGAIGRALAALGYGTAFAGEELNEGERIIDSPIESTQDAGSGELDELKSYVGKVWGFSSAQMKAKWEPYKQTALGEAMKDSDLTHAHMARLRLYSVEEEKRRKEKQQSKANGTNGK